MAPEPAAQVRPRRRAEATDECARSTGRQRAVRRRSEPRRSCKRSKEAYVPHPYRQQACARRRRRFPLEREWLALSRPVSRRLPEWGAREPALARFRSPDELIRFLLRPGPWAARDAVLAALLAQARVEPLAARVVLAALLPGLKRIAEEVILDARDREELWQLLLACAWERIRSYPLERRRAGRRQPAPRRETAGARCPSRERGSWRDLPR